MDPLQHLEHSVGSHGAKHRQVEIACTCTLVFRATTQRQVSALSASSQRAWRPPGSTTRNRFPEIFGSGGGAAAAELETAATQKPCQQLIG